MIFGMTIDQILWYFIIYSFIGWIVEVIFHAITVGKVINRGFLNGPWCPIYGFGMLGILSVINSLPKSNGEVNPLLLFIVGMIICTLVELIGGWVLDVAFNTRWWDYSDKPLNFHGYICLEFSIFWGLGVLIVVDIFHDMINSNIVAKIPPTIGRPILGIICISLLADFIVTVLTINGLNKKLKEIDELSAALRQPSDKLSQVVAGETIKTTAKLEETRLQATLAKAELKDLLYNKDLENTIMCRGQMIENEHLADYKRYIDQLAQLKAKVHTITKSRNIGTGRLLNAFPEMKNHRYEDILQEIKNYFK